MKSARTSKVLGSETGNMYFSHVAALQVLPGSSEAIAHGTSIMICNDELRVNSLHAVIRLLRLQISLSTRYALVTDYCCWASTDWLNACLVHFFCW